MKQLMLSFLVILPSGAFAAEVFVSVDENGVVVYSDRQLTDADEVMTVSGRAPAPTPRPAAARGEASNPQDTGSRETLTAEIPVQRSPEEIAALRARECESARERQANYSVAPRLYRVLENGEREYLTSDEIDATRLKADADVAAWCD